jgi:hypothetical protein
MRVVSKVGENPAMNRRVQGFHPAIQRFGEPRHLADLLDVNSRITNHLAGRPRRDEGNSSVGQRRGEDQYSILVTHGNQRTA